MDAFLIIMLILIAFLLALIAFTIGELTKSVKALPEELARVRASSNRPDPSQDHKG
ncbi:MAG TPA: hypothetical protein VM095_03920 [Pyrinomonadaceae bacterium]|nr:hypothetical protein [Pyrinomonadaceae bacterium]